MAQFVSSIEKKYVAENSIKKLEEKKPLANSVYGNSKQQNLKPSEKRLNKETKVEGYVNPYVAENPLLSYLTGELNPSKETNDIIEIPEKGGQIGQWTRVDTKKEEENLSVVDIEEESFKIEEKMYVATEESKGVSFKRRKINAARKNK